MARGTAAHGTASFALLVTWHRLVTDFLLTFALLLKCEKNIIIAPIIIITSPLRTCLCTRMYETCGCTYVRMYDVHARGHLWPFDNSPVLGPPFRDDGNEGGAAPHDA